MPNKGKYQPRKINVSEIRRFRGIADKDGKHNLQHPYVGGTTNLPSIKIRQMDSRNGQVEGDVYEDGINTGDHFKISRVIGEGSNLWAEVLSLLAPRGVSTYPPPTIPDLPPLPELPPPDPDPEFPDPPDPPLPPPPPPPVVPPPPDPPDPPEPPPPIPYDIDGFPSELVWVLTQGYSNG